MKANRKARQFLFYIKKLKSYLINSPRSIFGFFLLLVLKRHDIKNLMQAFDRKKILVIGSGPSLDLISQEMIDKYDTVVFLNAAIRTAKKFDFSGSEKFFFNSDLYRFNELRKELCQLDQYWYFIFIPIHLHLVFSIIRFKRNRNVYLLLPQYRVGCAFEKNVTNSFITYAHSERVDIGKDLTSNQERVPVFPYSVALSAFNFLVASNASIIHHIGCDFGEGRSHYAAQPSASFSYRKIKMWLSRIEKAALAKSIDLSPGKKSL